MFDHFVEHNRIDRRRSEWECGALGTGDYADVSGGSANAERAQGQVDANKLRHTQAIPDESSSYSGTRSDIDEYTDVTPGQITQCHVGLQPVDVSIISFVAPHNVLLIEGRAGGGRAGHYLSTSHAHNPTASAAETTGSGGTRRTSSRTD
jgi:hypothetical protein